MNRKFFNTLFKPKFYYLFFILFSIGNSVTAQFITPFTLNNGGGFGQQLEWNLGESVTVDHFSSPNLLLTTGVLQPLTNVVTGFFDYGTIIFGNEIVVGPNPTTGYILLKINLSQAGKLKVQLVDAKASLIQSIDFEHVNGQFEKLIDIENLPSCTLYLRIVHVPVFGKEKSGIFKIIKI